VDELAFLSALSVDADDAAADEGLFALSLRLDLLPRHPREHHVEITMTGLEPAQSKHGTMASLCKSCVLSLGDVQQVDTDFTAVLLVDDLLAERRHTQDGRVCALLVQRRVG